MSLPFRAGLLFEQPATMRKEVWALVLAPFLFKWALGVYTRAAPVRQRTQLGAWAAEGFAFVIIRRIPRAKRLPPTK